MRRGKSVRRSVYHRGFRQPHELAGFGIERIDGAVFDIINPGVELEPSGRQSGRDNRMRFQITELAEYIFMHERVQARFIVR